MTKRSFKDFIPPEKKDIIEWETFEADVKRGWEKCLKHIKETVDYSERQATIAKLQSKTDDEKESVRNKNLLYPDSIFHGCS